MSCQNNSVCPVAFLSLLSGLTTCPHVELCSILCRSGCSVLGLPPLPVHPWGSMPLTVAQITSHSASLHCLRSQQLLPAWIAGRTSKGEAWQPCCSCLTACSLKWRRASHTVLILRWGANMRAALRGTCSCHREEQMWCAGSGAGILAVMVVASWGAEWRCMGTCTRTSSPSSCWAMNAACCLLSLCLWLLWLRMGGMQQSCVSTLSASVAARSSSSYLWLIAGGRRGQKGNTSHLLLIPALFMVWFKICLK